MSISAILQTRHSTQVSATTTSSIWPKRHLQALTVVLVAGLASVRRGTSSRPCVSLTTTLTIMGNGSRRSRSRRRSSGRGRVSSLGRGGGSGRGAASTAAARSSVGTLADGERGGARAAPALDGDGLVVEGAELHAESGPGAEVVLEGDGAAGAGSLADAGRTVSIARRHGCSLRRLT